jgi:hypothetical protein
MAAYVEKMATKVSQEIWLRTQVRKMAKTTQRNQATEGLVVCCVWGYENLWLEHGEKSYVIK